MIEHEYSTLFGNDSVDKQIVITTDNNLVTITNNELHNESFELKESIFSGNNLEYGTAVASSLKFTVSNVFTNLKNQVLNVSVYLNHDNSNPLKLGRFKVYSDIPTADRKKREIVAYDALYDVLQADVTAWYNSVLPNSTSTITLKAFRDSFFAHFGITQEEIELVNDNMVVKKTIQPEELSGKVVLNAICEINACFGHINRNGNFKYIYLTPISQGLYPSEELYPSESIYPNEPNTHQITKEMYISATYEEFITEKIDKLQIRQEENDIGVVIGNGNNAYVIENNFLVYGKKADELQRIAENIYKVIKLIYYRPYNATARGNFCLEVGDSITLVTKYQGVMSYVLERTIKGIQSLRDDLSADGEQYQPTKVNSTNRSIQQLSGKYNKLTRTVDETRLEMGDMEKNLYSTISITAGELRSDFSNVANGLESQIIQNANEISLKVSSSEVQSMIDVSLDNITIDSRQINLNGYFTANGDFSVDLNGNLKIENQYSSVALSGYDLDITDKNTNNGGSYGSSAITHYGIQWMSVVNAGASSLRKYIMLGNPSNRIYDLYVTSINGYEPITTGNINSYIPSTSNFATKTWVSNNFASYSDLSSYLLESDFDNWVNNALDYRIGDIESEIEDLKERIRALEAAI